LPSAGKSARTVIFSGWDEPTWSVSGSSPASARPEGRTSPSPVSRHRSPSLGCEQEYEPRGRPRQATAAEANCSAGPKPPAIRPEAIRWRSDRGPEFRTRPRGRLAPDPVAQAGTSRREPRGGVRPRRRGRGARRPRRGRSAATMARASASEPNPPAGHRLEEDVWPAAVRLDGAARVDRPPAGVGRELAEQGVPRPPADDVGSCGCRRAEDPLQPLDGPAVTSAPGSPARSGANAPSSPGGACAGPRAEGGQAARACRRARGTSRRPDRPARRTAGRASARAASSSYDSSRPARAQVRRHSCTSQSPMMFLSSRVVPATPPSLVKL